MRISDWSSDVCSSDLGDVMHGPAIPVAGRQRKVYLVSLMDDASRLITHSAFCLGETALDIEGVLKQALLKRGVCRKLVVDNGAAYRAQTLQGIRSEEHTSELQSLMRISYAVFCLKKKKQTK